MRRLLICPLVVEPGSGRIYPKINDVLRGTRFSTSIVVSRDLVTGALLKNWCLVKVWGENLAPLDADATLEDAFDRFVDGNVNTREEFFNQLRSVPLNAVPTTRRAKIRRAFTDRQMNLTGVNNATHNLFDLAKAVSLQLNPRFIFEKI